VYVFQDINGRYRHHFLSHSLISSGMLFSVGIIGIILKYEPRLIFFALLCTLTGALIARVFLLHIDYAGGVKRKHVIVGLAAIFVSGLLLAWTYKTSGTMVTPQFKGLVLPFLLASLLLTHLPFLVVHRMKRLNGQL